MGGVAAAAVMRRQARRWRASRLLEGQWRDRLQLWRRRRSLHMGLGRWVGFVILHSKIRHAQLRKG